MNIEVVVRCCVLSIASSLDNFAVGTSLGLYQRPLKARLNFIVSICNAVGALLSSQCGALLGSQAPDLAALLGASIFIWLGASEWDNFRRGEASPLSILAEAGVAWRLALPMTLNNLAGGVAGGLAGVSALEMGLGAATASYGLMWFGHLLGQSGAKMAGNIDPGAIAAVAFLGLGMSQLSDVVGWSACAAIIAAGFSCWRLFTGVISTQVECNKLKGERDLTRPVASNINIDAQSDKLRTGQMYPCKPDEFPASSLFILAGCACVSRTKPIEEEVASAKFV